jgi:hypothetical protein
VIKIWDENDKCGEEKDEEEVFVTVAQQLQTKTFVRDVAIRRIEVSVRSNVKEDKGIVVTYTLGSLVQGDDAKNSPSDTAAARKEAKALRSFCQQDIDRIVASQRCPAVRLYFDTLPTTTSAVTFSGLGKHVMWLNTKPCNVPMIPLLRSATLRQESNVLRASSVQITSYYTFSVNLPNPFGLSFVAGPATLTLEPTNPSCERLTFTINFTGPLSVTTPPPALALPTIVTTPPATTTPSSVVPLVSENKPSLLVPEKAPVKHSEARHISSVSGSTTDSGSRSTSQTSLSVSQREHKNVHPPLQHVSRAAKNQAQ